MALQHQGQIYRRRDIERHKEAIYNIYTYIEREQSSPKEKDKGKLKMILIQNHAEYTWHVNTRVNFRNRDRYREINRDRVARERKTKIN